MNYRERALDAEFRENWREAADCWHALMCNTPRDQRGRGAIIVAWRYAEAKAPPAEAPF